MIYKANEASYDANGRSVQGTKVSDVGRGRLFVKGDEDTDGSLAIRIINNVSHYQRRVNGNWVDAILSHQ